MELFPFRQPTTARADGDLAAIARQLDDVMAGTVSGDGDGDDVDLRAYLLDPPPTEVEAARADRRRRMVRTGSVVATMILAVLLLAPWPSGDVPDAPQAKTVESTFAGSPEATLPARVDVPAVAMEAPRGRADTRPARGGTSTPRRAAGRRAPVRQVASHRQPATAARPAPTRRTGMPARDRSTPPSASPRPSATPPPPAPISAPAAPPPATGGELVPIL